MAMNGCMTSWNTFYTHASSCRISCSQSSSIINYSSIQVDLPQPRRLPCEINQPKKNIQGPRAHGPMGPWGPCSPLGRAASPASSGPLSCGGSGASWLPHRAGAPSSRWSCHSFPRGDVLGDPKKLEYSHYVVDLHYKNIYIYIYSYMVNIPLLKSSHWDSYGKLWFIHGIYWMDIR